jgi:formamidopyrimidine-DNA glycosylase
MPHHPPRPARTEGSRPRPDPDVELGKYTGGVPELPEVEALALDLRGRLTDRAITRVDLAAFSALKTFDPPLHALHGTLVEDVTRHGKFLDIATSGLHLVIHLARAGWIRWRDEVPALPARPNSKSPLAARVVLDETVDEDGSARTTGLDITEAGTKKSLAIYVVRDPLDVPGIARLGPDPLDDAFTIDVLAQILADAGRAQIKGVLRHQGTIAGIGNAYSDELLHAAKMSPFKPANGLSDAELQTLYDAIRGVLGDAVERSRGLAMSELKGEKKSHLAVHGRTGEKCPVCGDTVREVSFADSSLQYCPTCQTGGKPLADRRLSRLLK